MGHPLTDSNCNCSAVIAFNHCLASNTTIPPTTPLFSFETNDESWAPMWWVWFLDHYYEVWSKAGLVPILGHRFHIGSTTVLLLLGIDPWIL